MSEQQVDNQEQANVEAEATEQQEVDYRELYEKAQADLEALAAKKDELLGETKKAKEAYRTLQQQLDAEEKEKAKENGDYEKLLQSLEQERNQAKEELNTFKQQITQEKINNQAMKVATELKARPESSEIVAEYLAREMKNVADENGVVSETALNAIKHQFEQDARFKPLLQGNQSSGGGAAGGKGRASEVDGNQLTRSEWNKLSAEKKSQLVKNPKFNIVED